MLRRCAIVLPSSATVPSMRSSGALVFAGVQSLVAKRYTMVTPPPSAQQQQGVVGGAQQEIDQAQGEAVPCCPVAGNVPGMSCPMEDGKVEMTPKEIHKQLGKHRLSGFVSSTAVVGYVLCGGTSIPVLSAIAIGTYLQGCSANCLNQVIEVENDRLMKRTCKRPLVVGAITKPHAVMLSMTNLGIGTSMLYFCHPHAAGLGLLTWVLYVGVYTPLKKVSTTNTWWGAIVGGIPPLMGGVAATSTALTAPAMYPAWLLGGIMLVWQIPHFMALAFHCRRDYEGAGFKMLAFEHPTRASVYAVTLTVAMAAMTIVGPAMCGMPVEPWFYVPNVACNAAMLYKAVMFHVDPVKHCRSCFVFSYMYLAMILALFTLNHFQPVTNIIRLITGEEEATSVAAVVIEEKKDTKVVA